MWSDRTEVRHVVEREAQPNWLVAFGIPAQHYCAYYANGDWHTLTNAPVTLPNEFRVKYGLDSGSAQVYEMDVNQFSFGGLAVNCEYTGRDSCMIGFPAT